MFLPTCLLTGVEVRSAGCRSDDIVCARLNKAEVCLRNNYNDMTFALAAALCRGRLLRCSVQVGIARRREQT